MTTEDEVNKAFAYAKLAGITMMVGVPDAPLLELSERKCKETASRSPSTTTARPTSATRARRHLHADQQDGSSDGPLHRRRPHAAPGPRSRRAVREVLRPPARRAHEGRERRGRRRHDRRESAAGVIDIAEARCGRWRGSSTAARCTSSTRRTRKTRSRACRIGRLRAGRHGDDLKRSGQPDKNGGIERSCPSIPPSSRSGYLRGGARWTTPWACRQSSPAPSTRSSCHPGRIGSAGAYG